MQYYRLPYEEVVNFCEHVFAGYGFTQEQAERHQLFNIYERRE